MKKLVFFHILFLFSAMCIAQEDKKSIIKGNKAFDSGDFSSAAEAYRSAEESERMKDIARFNLGDALYRQGKFEEAADAFGEVAEESTDESLRSRAYHNLGNSMLSQQDYAKAMNSYKKALRLNPQDEEARYNLAYSRRMLQKQQEQNKEEEQENKEQEQENKEQEENKDQEGEQDKEQEQGQEQEEEQDQEQENQEGNKDQEGEDGEQDQEGEQDKEQEQENKEQEGNKDQEGKEGEQGEQGEEKEMQIDPNSISPEDAARILEALDKAEEDLQGKLRKHKKGKGKKIEKDW